MRINISQIVIVTIISTFFVSCSSPKSIYMGSDYGKEKYIYKNEWPREDKQCYYWNTGKGENWYIAQVKKTGKRGVIDKKRNIIIPIKYNNIAYLNGVFKLTDDSAKYYAVYDTLGQPVIDWNCKYTDISVKYGSIGGKKVTYFICENNIIRDIRGNMYDLNSVDFSRVKEAVGITVRWYGRAFAFSSLLYNQEIGFFAKEKDYIGGYRVFNVKLDANGHLYRSGNYKPEAQTKNYSVGEYNKERNSYKWYSTSSGSNKKGAQSTDGSTIVPAKYTKVEYVPYYDGYFVVWSDGCSGVYNCYGNNLIPVSRGYSSCVKTCSDGRYYYRVCKNGLYGACDLRGREIIAPKYGYIILYNGVFLYKDKNGEWIPLNLGIDRQNRIVKNPSYTPCNNRYYEITLEQNQLEESFGKYVEVEQISTTDGSRAFKLVFDDKILFEFGKYDLNGEALDYIDEVASALKKLPSAQVRVTGYTDNIGGLESNQILSTRRAQAVGNRLQQKGVSASHITTKGIPLADYVATNDTEEGRALNRRVEIIIEE